jgi:hypothetical protein
MNMLDKLTQQSAYMNALLDAYANMVYAVYSDDPSTIAKDERVFKRMLDNQNIFTIENIKNEFDARVEQALLSQE